MQSTEFARIRKIVGKTQKEMAQLFGISLKAIHSYEQGWRNIPMHVERQAFLILSRTVYGSNTAARKVCWSVKECSLHQRHGCPAWQYRDGKMCWFINGTICEGSAQSDWKTKMAVCRNCVVFSKLLEAIANE